MRLKKSKNEAEEELTFLAADVYTILNGIENDYREKTQQRKFDKIKDNEYYKKLVSAWQKEIVEVLKSIFPTQLEANRIVHLGFQARFSVEPIDNDYFQTTQALLETIKVLEEIIQNKLPRYTDLPIQLRLYIEDIDSFAKVRSVNPAMVAHLLINGYLDQSEDFVQLSFEQILNESFHRKDWGGEINDLYTSNIVVQGTRTTTAFLLKGNGLKKKEMQIGDCGKNGDQLLRLFESPAQLFIIQFVGNVSDRVIKDIESKVELARAQGKKAWYCIINGQDTARILHAYGKL